jgi:hypothetical protein
MAVADFAEDSQRRLHIAREAYRDQEKRVAQEQADRKRHTEELLSHVLRRFSELARAAPDGLRYERGMSSWRLTGSTLEQVLEDLAVVHVGAGSDALSEEP